MNSSQVAEAKGDLARLSLAFRLTFKEGPLGPFKVVGRASLPGEWHVEERGGRGKLRQSTELAPIAEVTPRSGDEAAL